MQSKLQSIFQSRFLFGSCFQFNSPFFNALQSAPDSALFQLLHSLCLSVSPPELWSELAIHRFHVVGPIPTFAVDSRPHYPKVFMLDVPLPDWLLPLNPVSPLTKSNLVRGWIPKRSCLAQRNFSLHGSPRGRPSLCTSVKRSESSHRQWEWPVGERFID